MLMCVCEKKNDKMCSSLSYGNNVDLLCTFCNTWCVIMTIMNGFLMLLSQDNEEEYIGCH